MLLFDSHAHLHDHKFDADRGEAVARARAEGVAAILTLGTNATTNPRAIALAESEDVVLAAVGYHPEYADDWNDEAAADLERLLAHPKVCVLGEIGLDYFHHKRNVPQQRRCFREQLALARRLGMPVSIHSREQVPGDCYRDLIEDLKAERAEEIGGVQHCFAGSLADARELLAMGFHLGAGGSATYPKSEGLRDILRAVGPERLLLETDAPYLAPQAMRGKRNEPAFVAHTARALAPLFSMTADALAELCAANTRRAFRLAGGR